MNKLLKNTIFYSLGEICPRIISFLLLPIYTQYLSTSDYGILAYTNTVVSFLYVLGALALNSYVLRYYFIHTEESQRKQMIGSIYGTIFLMNLLILLLAYATLPHAIGYFHLQIPWDPYFKLAILVNFLDSFSIIPLVIYRVRQQAQFFVCLSLGRTLLQVVLNIYFIVFLESGLIGYYYAAILAYLPFLFVYLGIIRKYASFKIRFSYVSEGLKYALPLLPGSLAYLILSVSDRLILERNVAISEIGIYNVAFTLSLALNIVIQSGYKAIEPEIFKRYSSPDYYKFLRKVQSLFFVVIYVAGLGLTLFSQEVFYYFTAEPFHNAYKFVPILIIGVIMTGQNVIYGGVLSAERKTKVVGMATLCGAITSVSLNIFLTPVWGVTAAALSSALSFFLMNTILFVRMTYPGKSMLKETLSIIGVVVISLGLFYLFPSISWEGMAVKLLGLVAYAISLMLLFHLNIPQTLRMVFPAKK